MGILEKLYASLGSNGGSGDQGGSGYQGSGYQDSGYQGGNYQDNGTFNWQNFMNMRQQVIDRNQALGVQGNDFVGGNYYQPNSWRNYLDQQQEQENFYRDRAERSLFSNSGGTDNINNGKYRKANFWDTMAIEAGKGAEWWMNLPSNLAGMAGNEQLAQDLKFNPGEFDPSNGFDMTDAGAVGKFALSIPGMIPGGLLEGVEKGYEALTGAPVQERREAQDGGYEIRDYQLDAAQRAASGIDAAIDLAGTFTGGAGKAVSVVGKGVARKAASSAGKALESAVAGHADDYVRYKAEFDKLDKRAKQLDEFASNMGKGAFERAGFGKGAQFVHDVANEGAEEFAQSYLEDIRNKELGEGSFDKAVQSAAWGAFGGGLMHGMGELANKAVHGRYDKEHSGGQEENVDPQAEIQAQDSQYHAFEKFADRNNVYHGNTYTDATLRYAQEKAKKPNGVPASASAYGTMFDDSLSLTEMRGSLGLLDGIVETADGGKSIANLAKAFHTDTNRINEIAKIRDDDARLTAWNDLLNESLSAGRPVRLVAGRNPDTNGVGTFYVDLVSIEKGSGVSLNKNAWKALGGDVDGDRYQTYFSMGENGMQTDGYITDSLIDETGHSRLNEDYTYWAVDKQDVGRQKGVINDALTAINDNLKERFQLSDNILSKDDIKGILKRFDEAAAADSKTRLDTLTNWFVRDIYIRLSNAIRSKGIEGVNNKFEASRYAAQVEKALHNEATRTAKTFEQVLEQEQIDVVNKFNEVMEDSRFLRSGDTKGMKDFAEFAATYGYKTGTNLGMSFGNPIMRQSGGIRFETLKDLDIWFNHNMPETEVEDKFARLIAFSFSLESIGADVQNAIEGVFWTSVVDSTLTRFQSKDARINIGGNWSEFENILKEEYKQKAELFNKALGRQSTQEFITLKVGAEKNPDLADTRMGLAQVFRKAFGDYTIESLVAIPGNSPLKGMTVQQIVNEFSLGNIGSTAPFGDIPSFNDFFKLVIKDNGSNFRALESRYHGLIAEAAAELSSYGLTDISSLIHITRNDSGKVSDVQIIAPEPHVLKYAIEAAHYTFGEDVCFTLGIESLEGFLTSKWGQEWMSGDVDRMMNAVFSAKLTHLYNNAINIVSTNDGSLEELKDELIHLQSEGGIFESVILRRWEADGNLGFLRLLTDLDVSYAEKAQFWQRATQEDQSVGGLFAEMIGTPNSDLGTSAFTNQIKNAKRSMAQVRQRSNAFNLKILENIDNSNISDPTKIKALRSFMTESYTTMSTNAIASFLYNQRRVVKGMVDKGVAPSTADLVYQISEKVKDGQLFSYLDGLDFNFGNMIIGSLQTNRVQLCGILSDPTRKIRVFDRRKNGYITITRDGIFKEVLGEGFSSADLETDWNAWRQLFQRCPALVSIIAPTHVGVLTKDGKSTAQEGYAKTLDKAIQDFKEEGENTNKQYHRKQLENRALAIAMRDPNWWAAFVAESGVSKAKTEAEAFDITKSAIKRHVNWILGYASHKEGGEEYIQTKRYLGDVSTRQAWRHVDRLDADNELANFLMQTLGTVDSHMYGQMSSNLMNKVVDSGFESALRFSGYSIENGEIKKVDKEKVQQDLQEMMRKWFSSLFDVNLDSVENFSIENIKDVIKKDFARQADILFVMQNLIDTSLFRYDQIYNKFGRVDEVLTMLDTYKKANPDDTNIDAITNKVKQWKKGDLGGLSDILFGEDIFSNVSQKLAEDVIPNAAVTSWSADKFKDAVHNICKKYNFNESEKKIDKAIDAAFADDNVNAEEEKTNIKNYFNQIILNWELNKITPAGSSQNHLAPKQTVEAYQAMIKIGDKVREDFEDSGLRIESESEYLPSLDFNFEDTVTSIMSAHMGMNAASGAITTGIGLDGAMLQYLAGFGLLDTFECGALPEIIEPGQLDEETDIGVSCRYTDTEGNVHDGHIRNASDVRRINQMNVQVEVWRSENCLCGGACSRCAPISPNAAQLGKDGSNKHSITSRIISTLINWMQEPRHLKAKKALGKLLAFDDPREINTALQKAYSPTEVNNSEGTATAREMLLNALNMRRNALSEDLHTAFTKPDVKGDLHFDEGDRVESTLFANLMTNFVEVVNANGDTFIVSASALASEETFNAKGYDFGYGPGVIPADGVAINPVVMSLQEVAEKIVRETLDAYYLAKDSGNEMKADAIKETANKAMLDWDHYNDNPITMAEFLDGIVPNPPRIESAMFGDGSPSSMMMWNELNLGSMSSVMKSSSSSSRIEDMSDESWTKVLEYNKEFRDGLSDIEKLNLQKDNTMIVAVHGSDRSASDVNRKIEYPARSGRGLPKLPDTGNYCKHTDKKGNEFELAEIYVGDNPHAADVAYKQASDKGRLFFVPFDVATGMTQATELDIQHTHVFHGEKFVMLSPAYKKWLQSFKKENVQLPTTELSPDEIVTAMGSMTKLGSADASHYRHPDLDAGKTFTHRTRVAPTRLIDVSQNRITLVDSRSDITGISMDDVIFSYYDNNIRNRNIGNEIGEEGSEDYEARSYRDAVKAYLEKANDAKFNPKVLTDVKQGDCIGLVRQIDYRGHSYYAPIFYEGTVAKTAERVVVKQKWNGFIDCAASSSYVDFNGDYDAKLDMYGIAYKSMGRIASDEILQKWAAIKDGGFGVVNRPDVMFDARSVDSRLVELGDKILHYNMYYYTRKAGVNAFFRRSGDEWVLRDDLNASLSPSLLIDLCDGNMNAWSLVGTGQIKVYQNAKMNELFQRATNEILSLGGWPHLMFNSARVSFSVNEETGEQNIQFEGLERRNFDPHAVFKNWNTDDFLALWNGIDSRLCPATLTENPDEKGQEKVFDRRGQMLDYNTLDGNPERVRTLIGPHFFTAGEDNAIGDYSRGATYANQHIMQQLMRSGVYNSNVREAMEALSVGVGDITTYAKTSTPEEELAEWRKHRNRSKVFKRQDTYDRAGRIVDNPLWTSLAETRQQTFIDIIEDVDAKLPIVYGKDSKSVFEDPMMADRVNTLQKQLNSALGGVRLTMDEVIMLVRFATGTTTHTNLGKNTITFDQFQNAVNHMLTNIKNGQPIVTSEKLGTRGNERYQIPLMPRGLVVRLSTTDHYQKLFNGDVNAIIDNQYDMLRAAVDGIKTIKDKSKQKALMQFADAMCYTNGKNFVSGNIIGDIYMFDLISAARDFAFALTDYDPEIFEKYDEQRRISEEWANNVATAETLRRTSKIEINGDYKIANTSDPRNIMVFAMRQLAAARKAIGLTYIEMPLSNCLDRQIGQTGLSLAMGFGRHGIGTYTVKDKMNDDVRKVTPTRDELKQFWSALRDAQMLGVERDLLNKLYNGIDLKTAIQESLKEQGAIERFSNKLMNIASGKDWGIEKQISIFLDRFWQRSETEAPWWHMKMPGSDVTVFEERLSNDPVGLMTDLLSGNGEGKAADALLARQCMQFALAGDNAQKNLVSAIHTEYAKQSALYDFTLTTFVSPYFNYATNRLGRVLNAVAPISSLHYMAVELFTKGPLADMKIKPGSEITFGQLGLEEYQVKSDLKEAIVCDMIHMGGSLVAMTLAALALNMSGILEPPDDPNKRGNFEEWTFFGMRINANWWIEDSLGIALPLAIFMASSMRGEPRIDLITGGLAHYLGNNPLVKVSDAVKILFDPMAELYQEYENDLEGYAKAMGRAPDIFTVAKGQFTSFGLSYVSQFITPGFLREIYQAGQGNEVAYKRIFETDQTGQLTLDAKQNNATQYTSYEDAVLRKFTKDNPVMGFLADILFRPTTGYMNHEMPDRVIYDPELMNSVEAFSIYEDPYTKQVPKSAEEQLVIAQMVFSTLQGSSVQDLVREGFMIDYDTKNVVGQYIWDLIAAENAQWAYLEQNGYLSYYNAPYGDYDENVSVISEMRQTHYNYINYLKEIYNKKLWADELKVVPTYNQTNTEWAQDVYGNWYATGFEPATILSPIKLAPGESPGYPQTTMSAANDWQTQSVSTGNPLGQRALRYVDAGRINTPDKPSISSYSEDGTDTGHSKLYNNVISEAAGKSGSDGSGTGNGNKNTTPTNKSGYPRRSGGGGGYRRSGGGGGGGYRRSGGYTPSFQAPRINEPGNLSYPRASLSKVNPSRIMNTDRLVEADEQYLRPDFETKGSREAYKRSDI